MKYHQHGLSWRVWLYAGEAVEYAKTIQPKKANWSKNRHKFTDTITLSRKCNSKPI